MMATSQFTHTRGGETGMTTRNALVPIDGSASSMRALEYAGKRFRDSGNVCLLLLNVQTSLPSSRHVSRAAIKDHYARMPERCIGQHSSPASTGRA